MSPMRVRTKVVLPTPSNHIHHTIKRSVSPHKANPDGRLSHYEPYVNLMYSMILGKKHLSFSEKVCDLSGGHPSF